ncbi:MAG: hypothetical protein E7001_07050 [Coriobacteriaceae bacterium]|nr:hypothetical protein [Coriobacteriaceae bacterium]
MKAHGKGTGPWGPGARRIAGAGAVLAIALSIGLGASPARAAGPAPEGATGVWTFEGPTPLQGTGSGNLSITEQANPNGTVKIQDSGLSSLGKALTFTDKGAAHDIRVRGAIEQQKDFTVSFWVRDAEDSAPAAGKRTLLLHSAGQETSILTEWRDGTFSSSIDKAGSNIELGRNPARKTWQHVTLVKRVTDNGSAKSLKLYLNGTEIGQGSWSQNLPAGAVGLVLGSWGGDAPRQPDNTERFHGQMDELRLYNKALSAKEVKRLFDSYGAVKAELEVADAKADLGRLIDSAKGLLADDDGSAEHVTLREAVAQAEDALRTTDAAAIRDANGKLGEAIGGVRALGLPVTVDTGDVVRTLDRSVFGINHRYAFNGYGSFDPVAMKVKDDFAALYDEAGFGSIRYPGGTISNLFSWKETIGAKAGRTKQIHGFYNNPGQGGIEPNLGISEIGTFAREHGSEIVYVYGLGRGDAADAADLVEFLNAEAGTNPNGGTAWADVRRDLGHAEPFNVRYFEIGNEMNQGGEDGRASQQYWTSGVPGGAEKAYVDGGTASFTGQYAVRRGDWNVEGSKSTGKPDQEFGLRYALPELDRKSAGYSSFTAVDVDSVKVKVGGELWSRVEDIKQAGATDKVYQLNAKTGYFTFGDGAHGAIPAKDAQITVDYSVERDGFVKVSQKMRDTMRQINRDRADAGKPAGEMHVYASYETEGFVNRMHDGGHDALYDGLTIHPYSGNPGNAGNAEGFYLQAMKMGDDKRDHVANYVKLMQRHDPKKVPVISEYGIFRSEDPLLLSQVHALYIARAIMDYVELGSPYIQKHCLVDWYSKGADSLGPTQQAVIQAVPTAGSGDTATGEGGFTFFKTPSASVFTMLNSGFGTKVVSSSISDAAIPKLPNGVSQYDVMASTGDDGTIYLAAVNLALRDKGALRLKVPGVDLTGRTLEIRSLSGADFTSANSPDRPDAVRIASFAVTADKASPRIELEPHSFTIVKVLPPAVKRTVTFQDGTEVFSTVQVEDGQAVPKPLTDPSREGHAFEGWMLHGAAYDFEAPVTSDLTLAASFKKIENPDDGGGTGPGTDTGSNTGERPDPNRKPGSNTGERPDPNRKPESNTGERPDPNRKPGSKPGRKPGKKGGLPATGDAAALISVVAAAGAALAYAGRRLGRRR